MEPVRRLRRAERREQLLDAATRAFARAGYTATGLDDIAIEAGVTRVILYRHFDSKADMYRAVLDRAMTSIAQTLGDGGYNHEAIPALLSAAASDPDGFRLLFRYAAREPEFRDITDSLTTASTEVTHRELAKRIPAGPWLEWAVLLIPTITIEAVLAWLDSGQPDPNEAAKRIGRLIRHAIQAAQGSRGPA
jgi:AcrR family transcriptional regulator